VRGLANLVAAFILAATASAHVSSGARAAQPLGRAKPVEPKGTIGLLWWPTIESAASSFARSMEGCLAKGIHAEALGLRVMTEASMRDLLFPLLEPSTQPTTEEEFGALLARSEVKERLVSVGVRYLVAMSGSTADEPWLGGIECRSGYPGWAACFGYSWHDQHTTLNASLWDLTQAGTAAKEAAVVHGRTIAPALIVPVLLPANTQSEACHQLAKYVVDDIRKTESTH